MQLVRELTPPHNWRSLAGRVLDYTALVSSAKASPPDTSARTAHHGDWHARLLQCLSVFAELVPSKKKWNATRSMSETRHAGPRTPPSRTGKGKSVRAKGNCGEGNVNRNLSPATAQLESAGVVRFHGASAYTATTGAGLTEEFSARWQMRIALAKTLLQKPNLLMLDDLPTTSICEARQLVEEYLTQLPYAICPHLARPLLPRHPGQKAARGNLEKQIHFYACIRSVSRGQKRAQGTA